MPKFKILIAILPGMGDHKLVGNPQNQKITYKEISLSDSWATFSRNFIPTRYIYDIYDIVSKFPAKIGSQVICTRKQINLILRTSNSKLKLPAATFLKTHLHKDYTSKITFFFNTKHENLIVKYFSFEPTTGFADVNGCL